MSSQAVAALFDDISLLSKEQHENCPFTLLSPNAGLILFFFLFHVYVTLSDHEKLDSHCLKFTHIFYSPVMRVVGLHHHPFVLTNARLTASGLQCFAPAPPCLSNSLLC